MGKRREWTDKETKEMIELYKNNYNFSQIGEKINRNKGSVRSKMVMLGIYKPKKKVDISEKNLWGIESLRGHIIDVEQAKLTAQNSHKKLLFKCSNCDNTKMVVVHSLVRQGFFCKNCSTNISYPERFMLAVDEYFGLNFQYQETYDDGRFDFVNHENKMVIEMNGEQHYKSQRELWKDSYKKTLVSDDKKRKWCEENGYTLIFIDARKSEFEFIRDNINECNSLPTIKKDDEKDIIELIEKNSIYDVKNIISLYIDDKMSSYEIGNKYNLSNATICKILKRSNIKLRGGERKVRCVETGVIYKHSNEAYIKTKIHHIFRCCKGERKTAGGFHWEFVD